MKKRTIITILGLSLAASLPVQARNVKYMVPITAALESSDAKQRLDGSVKFFFGPQEHPAVTLKMGSPDAPGKGRIVDKSDIGACLAAFADALYQLQKNAKGVGANAIVNIVSNYKNSAPVSSATEYVCHAGSYSAGLTLKGDFVKFADK
jgi:hypothetical protein